MEKNEIIESKAMFIKKWKTWNSCKNITNEPNQENDSREIAEEV